MEPATTNDEMPSVLKKAISKPDITTNDEMPSVLKKAISKPDITTTKPPEIKKKNYLQETLAYLESFCVGLALSVQTLRHDMEKEYNLETLTQDPETE